MNRTILFRGKTLENGRWKRGSLILTDPIADRGQAFIVYDDFRYEVDRNSVGQFLCAIDGKEAFEGDFIECDYDLIFESGVCRGLLKWDVDGAELEFMDQTIPLNASCFEAESMRIVGNFTDNPEMWETCGGDILTERPEEPA